MAPKTKTKKPEWHCPTCNALAAHGCTARKCKFAMTARPARADNDKRTEAGRTPAMVASEDATKRAFVEAPRKGLYGNAGVFFRCPEDVYKAFRKKHGAKWSAVLKGVMSKQTGVALVDSEEG